MQTRDLCVRWLPTMNCSTSCLAWKTILCYLRSKYGTLGTMESLRGIYGPGPLMSLLWHFFGLNEPKKDGPLICLCVSVPLIALMETYPLVASIVLSLEQQRGWQKHLKYQYSPGYIVIFQSFLHLVPFPLLCHMSLRCLGVSSFFHGRL